MYEYPEEGMEQGSVENPGQIEKDGYYYPADEFGHAQVADGDGRWITTDPYGHLSYSFGYEVVDQNGMEDFLVCLDFLVLEAHVAFHAVRDSDSVGYIETADYYLVRHDEAVEAAGDLAWRAMDQVFEVYYMNGEGGRELDGECDNYPPEDEKFNEIREKFVEDVRNSLAHTPPPIYGYPQDEGMTP